MRARRLHPQPLLDERLLLASLAEHGVKSPAVHVRRLYRAMVRERCLIEPREVPELPERMYKLLESSFAPITSTVVEEKTSADRTTTKLLIKLQDGHMVESVIMRYGGDGLRADERATLCVSSQVGCKMACTFCATGTMGLSGNLFAGEILEQLVLANRVVPIRNVVFMGMGEPLDNYDNVKAAVTAMCNPNMFGLAMCHVTVSTVGVVPRMRQMRQDMPAVSLALSLHAPTQEARCKIVPTARQWHIDELIEVLREHLAARGNKKERVLIEYVVIKDINDSEEMAHTLGKLLGGLSVTVNLIPFNPTYNPKLGSQHEAPTIEMVDYFADIVRNRYGLRTTVRRELGQDINGACGQLVVSARDGKTPKVGKQVEQQKGAQEETEDDESTSGNSSGAAGGCSGSSSSGGSADIEDLAGGGVRSGSGKARAARKNVAAVPAPLTQKIGASPVGRRSLLLTSGLAMLLLALIAVALVMSTGLKVPILGDY